MKLLPFHPEGPLQKFGDGFQWTSVSPNGNGATMIIMYDRVRRFSASTILETEEVDARLDAVLQGLHEKLTAIANDQPMRVGCFSEKPPAVLVPCRSEPHQETSTTRTIR
ncbi:MAG: hypothetical protein PHI23_04630 [Candidatus Peribacteraceae bacterium]|nr:hypothetical protein [Candidatus Peribacteraceae bacterium]